MNISTTIYWVDQNKEINLFDLSTYTIWFKKGLVIFLCTDSVVKCFKPHDLSFTKRGVVFTLLIWSETHIRQVCYKKSYDKTCKTRF